MGIGEWIGGAISGVVKPVADAVTANTKRKQAREQGLNEIKKAQVDGQNTLNLTDAQWEAISAQGNAESWKDEYVTITMTSWIWLALVGCLMKAYGKPEVLEGVKEFLIVCTENGVEVGLLTMTVVTAAVGLKIWRNR